MGLFVSCADCIGRYMTGFVCILFRLHICTELRMFSSWIFLLIYSLSRRYSKFQWYEISTIYGSGSYSCFQHACDSLIWWLDDINGNTTFGKLSSSRLFFYSICLSTRNNCMVFSTRLKSNVCIQASYEKLWYKRNTRIALIIYDLCIQWN